MPEAPRPMPHADGPSLGQHRLAVVLAGVLWSTGGFFIKTLSANPAWHASALAITSYRSFFAALVLLPLLWGRKLPPLRESLVSIVIYFVLLVTYVAANQGTSAANAILLQYTAPLWALILGPLFFRERFQREDAFALVIAMAGMAVIFGGNFQGGEKIPLVMGLGSGLFFGIFLLWLRRLRGTDPISVTVINNFGVAVLGAFALAVLQPGELTAIPRALAGETAILPALGMLLLVGAVQIALPYVLLTWGLRKVNGTEAGLLALVEPLLNPIWVVFLIGERPTDYTLIGGALILLALLLRYTLFRVRKVTR